MTLAIIIAAAAVVGFSLFTYVYKKIRFKNFMTMLQTQNYEAFDKLIQKGSSKYLFPRYNLEYLKLNSYILRGDDKKIDECFDSILNIGMSKKQKQDIYMKAFNYYVGMENATKTKKIIAVIEDFDNEQMKKEARTVYDIFILKRGTYIPEMEALLAEQDDAAKGITEYLLSVQYGNLNNKKKANEYLELSKKHLNEEDSSQASQQA